MNQASSSRWAYSWIRTLKWACMVAAIFWILVYQMGARTSSVPGFVYANF